MDEMPLSGLHRLVWTALMAALIAVGSMTMVPVGPVPMTLQTLSVVLAGLTLGPVYGPVAMGLYILAGAMGLPVYSGGRSGFAHVFGPTGGYLAGFVVTAWLAGIGGRDAGKLWRAVFWTGAGLVGVYALGALRLMQVLDLTPAKAFAAGVLPFLPGDVVKAGVAIACWRFLSKRMLLPR